MSEETTSKNGGNKDLEGVEIEFPVTFQLKAVIDSSNSDEVNKKNLQKVIKKLNIQFKFNGSRVSSKGTYTSYHYNVTLLNKPQMDNMYNALKDVPGFKFAL